MKFLFSILFCFLLFSFSGVNYQVNKLPNGKYHVKFGKVFQTYNDYDITIQDSLYTIYHSNGDSSSGRIYWFDNLGFQLKTFQPKLDSLTSLEKLLRKSCGAQFFELNELMQIEKNIYNFRTTCTGNLHITLNAGQLIRILPAQ